MKASRRGISLVELLVAMSACATILSLTTVLMHRVMRSQSISHACLDVERNAFHLSESFRRDARTAIDLTVGNAEEKSGVLLKFQMGNKEIVVYKVVGGTLERVSSTDDEAKEREAFAFPPRTRFAVGRPTPQLVTLDISPQMSEADPLNVHSVAAQLHLVAVLQNRQEDGKRSKNSEKSP